MGQKINSPHLQNQKLLDHVCKTPPLAFIPCQMLPVHGRDIFVSGLLFITVPTNAHVRSINLI
jgi:hypothetical protein